MKIDRICIFWTLVMIFLFGSINVFAVVEEAKCPNDKYYKFQEGIRFEDFHPEKIAYAPGEEVILSYVLQNRMDIPIVEGKIRVQVLYDDANEREQIVDEFFFKKEINLMPGDIVEQEIKWSIPKNAKEGRYRVKIYFIVGEMFNLAGLSFIPYGGIGPGVPGYSTYFDVKNPSKQSRIYFSKEETKVNNAKYDFSAYLIARNSEPLKIETKLVNEGPEKEVLIELKTYEWDDLTDKPIDSYTVKKKILLPENGEEKITYELPALQPATYEIKFIATSGEEKSILKLRIPIYGTNGRFIYLSMEKFPITANEENALFFCLSNSITCPETFNGKGTIEILDSNGNSIFKENFGPFEVGGAPIGGKVKFIPSKSYENVILKATLSDDTGKVHDTVKLSYDYSKFQFVPSKLDLSLTKDKFMPGEKLTYALKLSDMNGGSLSGDILLYVLDSEGDVIYIEEKKLVGFFSDSIQLPEKSGVYTLSVKEKNRGLDVEKHFEIIEKAVVTTSIPVETTPLQGEVKEKGDYSLIVMLGAMILVFIVLIFLKFRGGRK
ncbi:MAG: hypothetical protein QXY62_01715 [Candidatus Altiarchaeota archaeon]